MANINCKGTRNAEQNINIIITAWNERNTENKMIHDMDGVNAGRWNANFCPNCGAKMDEPENGEDEKHE